MAKKQREVMTTEQGAELVSLNSWADEVLGEAIAKVGNGNLGGKLEELRRRLAAISANVWASEPMGHKRLEIRAGLLLARFGMVAEGGHGYSRKCDYTLKLKVEKAVDAIAIFERFGHYLETTFRIKSGGCTSFIPESSHNDERDGEPVDSLAYFLEVGLVGKHPRVCGFINSRDDSELCVGIEIELTDEPLIRYYEEPAVRDAHKRIVKPATWQLRDGTGYFPKQVRFSAPAGTPNTFIAY